MLEPPICSSGKCRRILPPRPAADDDATDEDEALPLPPPPMLPRPSFGMDTDLLVAGADDAEDEDSSPRRVTLARLRPSPLGGAVEAATLLSCEEDEAAATADVDEEARAKDEGACACTDAR